MHVNADFINNIIIIVWVYSIEIKIAMFLLQRTNNLVKSKLSNIHPTLSTHSNTSRMKNAHAVILSL